MTRFETIVEMIMQDVGDFRQRHGLSERQFCLAVTGMDHHLMRRVREKRATLKTVARIYDFMQDYSPEPPC